MRYWSFLLRPCLLLLTLGLAAQGEPQKRLTPKVDVCIQMDTHYFGAGAPLPLVLILKNTGPEDVTLEIPGLASSSEWDERQVFV
jgi:hypothetical protein